MKMPAVHRAMFCEHFLKTTQSAVAVELKLRFWNHQALFDGIGSQG